jgi:hypothetical protein
VRTQIVHNSGCCIQGLWLFVYCNLFKTPLWFKSALIQKKAKRKGSYIFAKDTYLNGLFRILKKVYKKISPNFHFWALYKMKRVPNLFEAHLYVKIKNQ